MDVAEIVPPSAGSGSPRNVWTCVVVLLPSAENVLLVLRVSAGVSNMRSRGPHAALCKHTCGPHKGYCNLVI
jgi:hypothetical protein